MREYMGLVMRVLLATALSIAVTRMGSKLCHRFAPR